MKGAYFNLWNLVEDNLQAIAVLSPVMVAASAVQAC